MGKGYNHHDYMDIALAPIEAQRDDALEELFKVKAERDAFEREVRLLRVQYDRRVEERDAAKAQNAVLRVALGDAENWLDIAQSIPETGPRMRAAHDRARDVIAKAKGGE